MVYTNCEVPLTRQQEKYYKELKNRMVMEAAEETVTAATAAVNMNKLLQISSGAVYTDDNEVVEFDIKHRYKVLREVIDESSKKVLIFVPFKHTIQLLAGQVTQGQDTYRDYQWGRQCHRAPASSKSSKKQITHGCRHSAASCGTRRHADRCEHNCGGGQRNW